MRSETPQAAQDQATTTQPAQKVARLRLDRAQSAASAAETLSPARADWSSLHALRWDSASLSRHHLYVGSADDEVTSRFDLLRTLLAGVIEEHGVRRLGVVAPTSGCGASFVAANLALAMARRPSARVLLADLNLRAPSQALQFGANAPGPLAEVLGGQRSAVGHLRLFGDNLALLLNSQPASGSAELLQEPSAANALREIRQSLSPSIEIFDLPPILEHDDVLSFLPQLDGVLLVADGTRSTATQVREAETLLEGRTRLAAVVLNRGEMRRTFRESLQSLRDRMFRRKRKV